MDPHNPEQSQTLFLVTWEEEGADTELGFDKCIYLFRSLEGVAHLLQTYWDDWSDLSITGPPMPPIPTASTLREQFRAHIQIAYNRGRAVYPMTLLRRTTEGVYIHLTLEEKEVFE